MALVERCGIWLSWNNQEDGFELPVLPAELSASRAATSTFAMNGFSVVS